MSVSTRAMAGSRLDRACAYPLQPCRAERIVICIDAFDDRTRFQYSAQSAGKQLSTLSTIKKCAEAFLLNKAAMNSNHQFAILALKAGGVVYMSNFHNRSAELVRQLQNISPVTMSDQPTQLGRIFQTVYDKVFKNLDNTEDEHLIPLRIVLFYGRPGTCVLDDNILANHKNVITDLLYIHRPALSAKEKKRITANYMELQACLSEKSIGAAVQSDSLLGYKYAMRFLMNPDLRLPNAGV